MGLNTKSLITGTVGLCIAGVIGVWTYTSIIKNSREYDQQLANRTQDERTSIDARLNTPVYFRSTRETITFNGMLRDKKYVVTYCHFSPPVFNHCTPLYLNTGMRVFETPLGEYETLRLSSESIKLKISKVKQQTN